MFIYTTDYLIIDLRAKMGRAKMGAKMVWAKMGREKDIQPQQMYIYMKLLYLLIQIHPIHINHNTIYYLLLYKYIIISKSKIFCSIL